MMEAKTGKQDKTFFESLINYYSEFLSTDFKKTRLPKRQFNKKDPKGNLVGINLNNYNGIIKKVYASFGKPVNDGYKFKIKRGGVPI